MAVCEGADMMVAIIKEKRVPVASERNDYLTDQIILKKLLEAEEEAAAPNAVWYSHEQVFGPLREKYGYA
jgi:hypothetical protein